MKKFNLDELLRDAQELKRMGFEEEALMVLEEISVEYPDCVESYLEQIDILLNRSNLTDKELEQILQKAQYAYDAESENLDCNYYLGYIYSLQRKWRLSLQYLNSAYSMDPEDIDVIRSIGWVQFHLGKREEGIAQLKKSIQFDGFYVEAMEDLAECYLYMEKFSEALIVIEQGMNIAPESNRLAQLKLIADSFLQYKKTTSPTT
ncbi:MAG: hypothetical protein WCP97_00720 [bacterium]